MAYLDVGRSRKKKKSTGRSFIRSVFVIFMLSALILFFLYRDGNPAPTETFAVNAVYEEEETEAAENLTVPPSESPEEPESETEEEMSEPAPEQPSPVTLLFAGDILFDPHYAVMASMLERSKGEPDISTAFDPEVLEIMRNADIFMVNNEFPYSDRGEPLKDKLYTFRAPVKYARLLNDMGADIIALANNHMYDHGKEALLDTLSAIENEDLLYTGAGRNIEEASGPVYAEISGMKIGFICATQIERMPDPDTKEATAGEPGVFRCLDSALLCKRIGEMKENCDFTVCYLHWGTESTQTVDEHQKKLARKAVSAGADLIIGDHPHVLQGIDYIDGVPVIYSLGNFLFNSKKLDTCLFSVTLDPAEKVISRIRFIPLRQENSRVRYLSGAEALSVIEEMRDLSGADITDDGYVTEK